jgi:molecular chaperone DnaK
MIAESKEYAIERRSSEEFEQAKQEAEKLLADIGKLFPKVEEIVAGSDFGKEAIEKARGVLERAKGALERKDLNALKEQIEALQRTQRMFKGVISKTG